MSSKTGMLFLSACVVFCMGAALNQVAKGQSSGAGASGSDTQQHMTSAEPFLGKWKLNTSKSKLSDEMKVAALGENRYAFDFGSGKLENIVTNGTDQAAQFDTTLAVTVEAPNMWRVVRKKDARTLISAHWELSNNGNTLTDHYTSYKPDGSANPTEDYEYKRTAGSSGFAGTWESTMEPRAFEVEIQPFEGDGLSFVNSDQKSARNIKFDGKDYPAVGANFPAGFTASGRRINSQTVQLTEKIGGDTFDTQDAELSADGKTLTMTQHLPSQSKPKIYVFDRE